MEHQNAFKLEIQVVEKFFFSEQDTIAY